jgi:hypothetical protein
VVAALLLLLLLLLQRTSLAPPHPSCRCFWRWFHCCRWRPQQHQQQLLPLLLLLRGAHQGR